MAQNNFEKTFQIYLLLKILYPSGKGFFSAIEIDVLSKLIRLDKRTVQSHLVKLEIAGWIVKNTKTDYFVILSLNRLNYPTNGFSNAAIQFVFHDLFRVNAMIGAAIFSYLHHDFWRKVKKKDLTLKGIPYTCKSYNFNAKKEYAPVALTGVNKLFDLSIKKTAILKREAVRHGLIYVRKSFENTNVPENELSLLKKYGGQLHIRKINGICWIQKIDLILPRIELCKRKMKITRFAAKTKPRVR